ncbi:FbpB family small basic protein [Sporolactobacillus sp. CPB3-1]|uniref:FbpB family small basic protein n=1 Tax=Sporolactobacillus mangiferae TaxID=2940498 RepID=A0ABT0MD07_9BACL|nr:FbpB family small basic protein [Sporolactobacillus mangiferae]MCL1632742.1 FbpB family small basic protein [Sporolactobacillus mangiferae]
MRRRLLSFNKLVQQNISEILNEKSTLQALEIKLDQRYTDKSKASEKQKSLFR